MKELIIPIIIIIIGLRIRNLNSFYGTIFLSLGLFQYWLQGELIE